MKELFQLWKKVRGRRYSSVDTTDRELRDFDNRFRNIDANLSECEELNKNCDNDYDNRRNGVSKGKRRQSIIHKPSNRLFLLILTSLLTLTVGFLICFLNPYNALLKWKIVFGEGGEIYSMWEKPEVQIYVRIFLFNVTNSEQYMAGTDKTLKLQEVGPYVYREGFEHTKAKFNENGTLSTVPVHPLSWVEELSEGNKEDDIVYMPHIALLSIAHVGSQKNFFTRLGLNNIISVTNSQPLARMTAREFMMGYKSELMTLGNAFMPGWIYFDKLGLVDRMYDFSGDYETFYTGETNVSIAGLYDTFRGSSDLPQWDGKHCSNIQYASDGTKFKGDVKENETLKFFRKTLCRPAPLVKKGEGSRSGIFAYEYGFPEHMLDNGKQIKENKCFCRFGHCLPEGLIDVTDCYYGFPIALSYPHFYKGDDILFTKLEGLNPSKEDHDSSFWLNPESGLPLDISSKFQINLALGDLSSMKNSEKFSNMYLPLLWFDIRLYSLPPAMALKFKFYLNILPAGERVLMYLCFISSVVLAFLAVHVLIFKFLFRSNTSGTNQSNLHFKSNIWFDNERQRNINDKEIYAPCEIPLQTKYEHEPRQSFLKTQGSKIVEFSHLLSEKVHGSVHNIRDKIDFTHGNNRKNTFINPDDTQVETNDAYRSDSGEDSERELDRYEAIKQNGSDCYLEVIDDGSEFDET